MYRVWVTKSLALAPGIARLDFPGEYSSPNLFDSALAVLSLALLGLGSAYGLSYSPRRRTQMLRKRTGLPWSWSSMNISGGCAVP